MTKQTETTPEKLLNDALASLGNFLLGDESVFTMEMKLKFARETCDAIQKWKIGHD